MAGTLWSYEEVIDHWDELILRAHIVENGERVLYQEGTLNALRRPEELMAVYRDGCDRPAQMTESGETDMPLPVGTALFCGTMPAIGGIRPSARFEMELEDPVQGRRLQHAVEIGTLPLAS